MLNLYECHFQYNDVYSRDYGLIIANIETERFMPIVGAKKGEFLFNRKQKASELMGDNYEDTPLSIDIEIVTCNSDPLDLRTIREVERWLFQNSKFRPLFIDMDDDPYGETYELINGDFKRLYLNCRFMNPEKIESRGGIIGFKCTLETDSMMMWQEPQTYEYNLGEPIIIGGTPGSERTLTPGDIDGSGEIEVSDAQKILNVYVELLIGTPPDDIKRDIIRPYLAKQRHIDESEVPEKDVDDAFLMCDLGYTADMYRNGVNSDPPDITVDDAQIALQMYVSRLVENPVYQPDVVLIDPDTNEYIGSVIEVYVDSDMDGYIYPEIELTTTTKPYSEQVEDPSEEQESEQNTQTQSAARSSITIYNETDICIDKDGNEYTPEFKIENIETKNMIKVSSQINYIDPVDYYEKITEHNFIRLVSGTNRIVIKGGVSLISFTWQNRRFL